MHDGGLQVGDKCDATSQPLAPIVARTSKRVNRNTGLLEVWAQPVTLDEVRDM
jgi:hypothetical protein